MVGVPLVPEVTRPLTAAMGTKWNGNGDLESSLIPAIVSQAMSSKWSKGTSGPAGDEVANLIPVGFAQNQRDEVREVSVAGALSAEPGMKKQTYLAMAVRTANTSANGHGVAEEVAHTIDQAQGQAIAFHNRQDPDASGEVTHPLGAKDNGLGIASFQQSSMDGRGTIGYDEGAQVLRQVKPQADSQMLRIGMQVRRLTPRECERLQGFPDDYTAVPVRGKPAADGLRYKALGNSMAVNVMRWIGERIEASVEVSRLEDVA